MNKLDIVKKVVSVVVCAGAATIVKGIIQNNTSPENVKDKVAIASAAVVFGSMVSEATSKHTSKMIDDAAKACTDLVAKYKEAKKKAKEDLEKKTPEEDPEVIEGEIAELDSE